MLEKLTICVAAFVLGTACLLSMASAVEIVTPRIAPRTELLTLGFPGNFTVDFGKPSFGAERPYETGKAEGITFKICGTVPGKEQTVVYGLRRSGKGKPPEVWRAETKDGIKYSNAKMIYRTPDSGKSTHWLAPDLQLGPEGLVLLICNLGRPAMKGHPFHAFGGKLDGTGWRKLNSKTIYRGQDSFGLTWNNKLKKFVNYQTTYQPFPKRFPDNMPKIRRVLHIRSSADGLRWTPGESFGADGPYLPADQLITPDSNDPPDTEFYHFAPIDLGEFWAGTMVKYVSQPKEIGKAAPLPHGPFLGCEWWVSKDGLKWDRPFRQTSSLDGIPLSLYYHLPQPVVSGEELRWVSRKVVYALKRQRMFYTYCRSNAVLTTKTLALSGAPISLEVDFVAAKRLDEEKCSRGYLMAELLDRKGKVIPGFERNKCVFRGNEQTRLTLKWAGRHLPPSGTDSPVRLRLHFREVRLYSVSY